LPFASAFYLMVNRIIPASFEPRELYEVSAFYIAWLLSLLISFSCSIRKGIIIMLYITAAVLFLIPVISVVLVPEASLLNSLKSVHWSLVGVDLALILLGLFYLVVLRFYQTKFITLGEAK
ncbi:PepSY-associated TM helix domain-containing protein, partial [Acinetobacter baumannii]|nr:PepSY domain-containing protein [Acinetobacter baumannii]